MSGAGPSAQCFVAVDWGSSRFRAYRVEPQGVSDRLASARGIGTTSPEQLPAALVAELAPWRAWIERERVPVRMAGMVGSNRGLGDAGYQRLPIELAALASSDKQLDVATPLATKVGIRPGLALADGDAFDVMRGEEVQLLGAHRLRPAPLYVFPGTHSKWVPVEDPSGRAQVRTFSTMMTGELHAWLVQGSMVCRGIAPDTAAWDDDAFARGIQRATRGRNVIEEVFRTRARWLLGDLPPAAAPSFLSGLLIGHELATMTSHHRPEDPLVVVGAERLTALYAKAAAALSISTIVISDEDATVEGFRAMSDGR
jgi:2-dehydro-3-deoxygalactonokinase